jgi:hypothetical protein
MSSLIAVLNPLDILATAVVLSWSAPFLAPLVLAFERWMNVPIVNTTLVFFEKNKDVFIPISDLGKQLAFAMYSTAIAILKPAVKALVVILRIVKPYILFAANITRITIHRVQQTGMSFTAAIQSMSEKLWDFGSSLAVVVKGFAYMVAYLTKGLSMVFNSFEHVSSLGYRILFHTNQVTWNEVSSAFIPLVVVTAVLASLYWMKRDKATPVAQQATGVPRRSSRLARKRALFSCGDFSVSAFPSEKPSATPPTTAGGAPNL